MPTPTLRHITRAPDLLFQAVMFSNPAQAIGVLLVLLCVAGFILHPLVPIWIRRRENRERQPISDPLNDDLWTHLEETYTPPQPHTTHNQEAKNPELFDR